MIAIDLLKLAKGKQKTSNEAPYCQKSIFFKVNVGVTYREFYALS